MSRYATQALMFDEDEVRNTPELLPRLIRIIFFGIGITNESFLDRYYHYYKEMHHDKTRKEFSQKAAADRKFLMDRRKITFNMLRSVLTAMGYDVECVSLRVRDRLTGEVKTFSTDDTVEQLKSQAEEERQVGVQGIM